jgi:hypothetical protein
MCEVGSGTVPVGCFDVERDPTRCGGCEMPCSTDNIAVACQEGACTGTCATDYDDCNLDKRTDGCETYLPTSDAHCGACNRGCSSINRQPGCSGGVCTGECVAGFGDCDESRENGCETDLTSGVEHCGACGRSCASLHVDSAVCEAGACLGPCTPGWEDCNGDRALDGCETNLDEDVNRCGGCGAQACSSTNITPDCSGGECVGACTPYVWPDNGQSYPRFADCYNDLRVDGCETDTWSDLNNCGVCGSTCPQGYICAWDGFSAAGCYPICEGCCCSAVGAAQPASKGRPSALFAGLIALIFAWRRGGRRARGARA